MKTSTNLRKNTFVNAWHQTKNNNGLTFSQNLKNAWLQNEIDNLQNFIDGCKVAKYPFSFYQKDAFKLNDLKKQIVRPQEQETNDTGEDFNLDFVMF
jgi:hypothetical protein